MIESLLIANRGEIACRIIRTARALGVRTIAVFSDADENAEHVRQADVAVRLGPAAPRESYLNVEALLAAARATGARAIHPGYGFLSENAEFAAACAAADIVFVGPPASAINAMGSKSAAKAAMARSGVPVLPGYHGSDQTTDALEREALKVGFPLIIKPSGGGGGKGMQIVEAASALREAIDSARRVAERSFGDGRLLIERYLPSPRHVEVQVLADSYGNIVHLHDRDCSVQRRHQKLIEEAPAPGIPDDVRLRLHEAAITVARGIGYVSAGTVEFLYSGGEFWFMEMNTRLQVEHPVTEAITGLDLVEWQLRIASGERLSLAQGAIVARGAAVEARICAEDPAADFVPSAGTLARLTWPTERDGIRVDAGFSEGGIVPSDYDSLLAKVIAWAPARDQAVAKLARALDQVRVAGLATNAAWLSRALRVASFRAGAVSTRFLIEEAAALAAPGPDSTPRRDAMMIAALVEDVPARRAPQGARAPWLVADSFRSGLAAAHFVRLSWEGEVIEARVVPDGDGFLVEIGAATARATFVPQGAGKAAVHLGGGRHRVEWTGVDAALYLWIDDVPWVCTRPSATGTRDGEGVLGGELHAKLPGTVTRVLVGPGEVVAQGQPLLVMEAMKMEHTIRAPYAGRVEHVRFGVGERVTEGATLIDVVASD